MRTNLKVHLLCGLFSSLFAASLLCAAPPQNSAQKTVFRIGDFNRSSAEFFSGSPKEQVNFVVSKSDPAKDWPGTHRAALGSPSASQTASLASAPRAITFSIEGAPAQSYRLHISVLIENASVPSLRVTINGKDGAFYLHPALDYSSGDQFDSFDPAYSSADVEFTFPGSYLRAGANTITLQPVEESSTAVPDAGFAYDAIQLDSVPLDAHAASYSAQLEPTIFFQNQNGELKECVEAFIRYGKRTGPGSADLDIGSKHYRLAIQAGHDFGEEKLQFLVSEFQPKTQAQLTVQLAGRKQKFSQSIDPKKKWTLYVIPHIHVDVGYSDYQAKIAAIQSRTIDEALDMTAQHKDFRFSLDGEWDLQQFMQTRSTEQKKRAIQAIQKGQVVLPAQYANLLTGIASTETLIRSFYPSANFSRKYGTPLDYANITDVPSYSWSYASILAAAGLHYFAAASNNYRAPVLLQGRLNENSPMWWEGPDGKRVFLWYSRHYMQLEFLFGRPPVMSAGRETIPLYLQMYANPNYRASAAIIYGTQVENTDLFPQQAELTQWWNGVYAYPHLQYSDFHEAIQSVEKQFQGNIPTIRGDGGPYWEDGAGADAYYTALERRNEARGLTAEKFATLTSFVNPHIKLDPAELARMWEKMVLMDEHTWTSYNSTSDPTSSEAVDQLAVKDQTAVDAAAQVDFLTRRSMANLANSIAAGPGSLIVFNSLNWKRNGLVSVDIGKGDELLDTTTNQIVPFEILGSGSSFHHVRFMATGIPPLGYKVYTMRAAKQAPADTERTHSTSLESPYYKVELDPETGAVRAIYDKQLQRELVSQQSPYRFGEYLYVTGGDKAPNTLLHYDRISPKADLTVHSSHGGKLLSVTRTPFGQVARMECENTNAPSIQAEIVLFDNQKKIEFIEHISKKEVDTKEAAYFAFPFSMSQPRFQYEIQNGVVDPAKDMYPGAGHEWFSAQHWASVEQDGLSGTVMPLDAPLITLGDINRGDWPDAFGKRPGAIFSYVMNNYWDTNYRGGQGGHFTFRYVVTSADTTRPADLSRMGWEEATPIENDIVTDQDKAMTPTTANDSAAPPATDNSQHSLDGKQQSFLDVSDPAVLLETWKPAEDGNGTILRLLDFGGTERTVTLRTPSLHLAHVWQTDAVERGQDAISMDGDSQFHFTIHPHQILTLRAVQATR